MPHTTPKTSRIPGPLHKAGLFVLFAAITAALCLLLNFLLVDDLHAYSRVTLGVVLRPSGCGGYCVCGFLPQLPQL